MEKKERGKGQGMHIYRAPTEYQPWARNFTFTTARTTHAAPEDDYIFMTSPFGGKLRLRKVSK